MAWKLGIWRDLPSMSLRELYACAEAHGEYHGGKPKSKPMSAERLAALNLGENVIITDFKGGGDGN